MAILDKIGRAVGTASRSKTLMGLAVAGAVTKGLSDTVGKSAIDNAMDIAFDDPEADRAVLGTDLTPSLLVAEGGFGPISGAARAMNMDKYGLDLGPKAMIGGGAIGTALGGYAGMSLGRGIKSKIALGIGGAIVGAGAGTAAGLSPALMHARRNEQLLRESPFSNSSLATAQSLNATGDIVLGMHNSRRN